MLFMTSSKSRAWHAWNSSTCGAEERWRQQRDPLKNRWPNRRAS